MVKLLSAPQIWWVDPYLMSVVDFFNWHCLVGMGSWKVGGSVGHCCFPPEPLLSQENRAQWVRIQNVESKMSSRISPECRAQQCKSTHRRVFVIWCRNMPDVLYTVLNEILLYGIWILLWKSQDTCVAIAWPPTLNRTDTSFYENDSDTPSLSVDFSNLSSCQIWETWLHKSRHFELWCLW